MSHQAKSNINKRRPEKDRGAKPCHDGPSEQVSDLGLADVAVAIGTTGVAMDHTVDCWSSKSDENDKV